MRSYMSVTGQWLGGKFVVNEFEDFGHFKHVGRIILTPVEAAELAKQLTQIPADVKKASAEEIAKLEADEKKRKADELQAAEQQKKELEARLKAEKEAEADQQTEESIKPKNK